MRNPARRSPPRSRGFSLPEILAVLAILGVMATMLALDAAAVIGRARASATLSGINQLFAAARLQAINRGCQVVVVISLEPPKNRINIRTFEDKEPDLLLGTYPPPLPATVPVVESILSDVAVDDSFRVWKKGGVMDDMGSAVLFNTYAGNPSLSSRIVFLPDGGILPPEAGDCGLPTSSAGRGFYFADARGKNFFRLTIPGNLVAMPVVEKWVSNAAGYSTSGWSWK